MVGIKLVVWILIIQMFDRMVKSSLFVACDMSLKRFCFQGLQLFFGIVFEEEFLWKSYEFPK